MRRARRLEGLVEPATGREGTRGFVAVEAQGVSILSWESECTGIYSKESSTRACGAFGALGSPAICNYS